MYKSSYLLPGRIHVLPAVSLVVLGLALQHGAVRQGQCPCDPVVGAALEITAPDNYIELYQLESDHAELNIDFTRHGINIQAKQVRIKIYTNDLTKIHNSGAANIWMEKLDTDKIEILNSGVGEIRVSGITDDAKLVCSGVGSIDAEHLKALNVVANVSGVGSITCHASESIEGSVSGVGSLKYAGNPKHKDTHRSGVGSITAL